MRIALIIFLMSINIYATEHICTRLEQFGVTSNINECDSLQEQIESLNRQPKPTKTQKVDRNKIRKEIDTYKRFIKQFESVTCSKVTTYKKANVMPVTHCRDHRYKIYGKNVSECCSNLKKQNIDLSKRKINKLEKKLNSTNDPVETVVQNTSRLADLLAKLTSGNCNQIQCIQKTRYNSSDKVSEAEKVLNDMFVKIKLFSSDSTDIPTSSKSNIDSILTESVLYYCEKLSHSGDLSNEDNCNQFSSETLDHLSINIKLLTQKAKMVYLTKLNTACKSVDSAADKAAKAAAADKAAAEAKTAAERAADKAAKAAAADKAAAEAKTAAERAAAERAAAEAKAAAERAADKAAKAAAADKAAAEAKTAAERAAAEAAKAAKAAKAAAERAAEREREAERKRKEAADKEAADKEATDKEAVKPAEAEEAEEAERKPKRKPKRKTKTVSNIEYKPEINQKRYKSLKDNQFICLWKGDQNKITNPLYDAIAKIVSDKKCKGILNVSIKPRLVPIMGEDCAVQITEKLNNTKGKLYVYTGTRVITINRELKGRITSKRWAKSIYKQLVDEKVCKK